MVRFTGIAEVELESRTFKPDFFSGFFYQLLKLITLTAMVVIIS